jgi:hypothetical protein
MYQHQASLYQQMYQQIFPTDQVGGDALFHADLRLLAHKLLFYNVIHGDCGSLQAGGANMGGE